MHTDGQTDKVSCIGRSAPKTYELKIKMRNHIMLHPGVTDPKVSDNNMLKTNENCKRTSDPIGAWK